MASANVEALKAVAHSFNKILNQPRIYSSKSRGTGESDDKDGTKKLRRLILVEGIPSSVVRCDFLVSAVAHFRIYRIRRYAHVYGRSCSESKISLQRHSCNTSREGRVKSEKRFEMIHSGE